MQRNADRYLSRHRSRPDTGRPADLRVRIRPRSPTPPPPRSPYRDYGQYYDDWANQDRPQSPRGLHPKEREKEHDEVDLIPVLTAEAQPRAPKKRPSSNRRSPTKKPRHPPPSPVRSGPIAAGYESELESRSVSQESDSSFRLVLENDEDL